MGRAEAGPALSGNGSWDPLAAVMADAGEPGSAFAAEEGKGDAVRSEEPEPGLVQEAGPEAEIGLAEEAEPEAALAEDAAVEADEWQLPADGAERVVAAPSPALSTLDGTVEELRFIRLSERATLPTRANDGDAGLDLYAAEGARIAPGGRVSVGTGLAVAVPGGLAGLVLPRSGLALKQGVTLVNSPGLIDSGYRGEVRILLLNTDRTSQARISAGDRIAQLLLVPIATASPLEADELDSTVRGEGGFGSTGA